MGDSLIALACTIVGVVVAVIVSYWRGRKDGSTGEQISQAIKFHEKKEETKAKIADIKADTVATNKEIDRQTEAAHKLIDREKTEVVDMKTLHEEIAKSERELLEVRMGREGKE